MQWRKTLNLYLLLTEDQDTSGADYPGYHNRNNILLPGSGFIIPSVSPWSPVEDLQREASQDRFNTQQWALNWLGLCSHWCWCLSNKSDLNNILSVAVMPPHESRRGFLLHLDLGDTTLTLASYLVCLVCNVHVAIVVYGPNICCYYTLLPPMTQTQN